MPSCLTSRQVAERLGVTLRHAARLAQLVHVPRDGFGFRWEQQHINLAARLLAQRAAGRGRFTLGQER